jgi:hypothetical protein
MIAPLSFSSNLVGMIVVVTKLVKPVASKLMALLDVDIQYMPFLRQSTG